MKREVEITSLLECRNVCRVELSSCSSTLNIAVSTFMWLDRSLMTSLSTDRRNGANTEISIKIRRYEAGDRDRVRAIWVTGIMDTISPKLEPEKYEIFKAWVTSEKIGFNDVDSLVNSENGGSLFVALDNKGQVIGCVGLRVSDEDKLKNRAELIRMVVSTEWRGKGIGKQLLRFVTEHATMQLKCRSIWLATDDFYVPACRMYERDGFARTNSKKFGDGELGSYNVWLYVEYEKTLSMPS